MRVRSALLSLLVSLVTIAAGVLLVAARPVEAATLRQITGFGSNPGNLQMFTYAPAGLATGRPLVVTLHGCGQTASVYANNTGWTELADRWGVALVVPQQQTGNNSSRCFNWFVPGDISRGQGEALSIKQMVDWARSNYGSAADRIYVTGLSAGGAMTAAMMAAYPDVFAGGGIAAGVPYRCAESQSAAFTCMFSGVNLSPQQWGDKVRGASSHAGPWPVLSVWHGTSDGTVVRANMTELVDQWTNVHGTDQTPDVSDTVAGYPHRVYRNGSGRAVVESFEITGMGHGQPIDPGTGSTQCGLTGDSYIVDVNICSAYRMGLFWGIATSAPPPTTTTTAPPAVECFTSSNYAHVSAGRAYTTGGYTYAVGSNQAMGLYNTWVVHTLARTAPNYYVLADNGCP
ncbi:MAG TPA: PHB depolymerase family esterase [Pseudonocardiaceae bacterium]|nr:PHB depolymerase family esterase [Pseudonocardiaceae bacterium]